jgi:hypothetical protein
LVYGPERADSNALWRNAREIHEGVAATYNTWHARIVKTLLSVLHTCICVR